MRVLFLRHDRVGDMIVSTGVMRAIARRTPRSRSTCSRRRPTRACSRAPTTSRDVIVFDKKTLASYLPTALRFDAPATTP